MSLNRSQRLSRSFAHDRADSGIRRCRYCAAPLRHYAHVGWIDVRDAYRDGTYDMCPSNGRGYDHEPESDVRRSALAVADRPLPHLFAANYAADSRLRRRD